MSSDSYVYVGYFKENKQLLQFVLFLLQQIWISVVGGLPTSWTIRMLFLAKLARTATAAAATTRTSRRRQRQQRVAQFGVLVLAINLCWHYCKQCIFVLKCAEVKLERKWISHLCNRTCKATRE
jgi:hypothetical protein